MPLDLHLISLDVPYPPDYGGAIDIFHKVRALHALGVRIRLHCFTYGSRPPREELASYCHTVRYYPRRTGLRSHLAPLPYIVYSRRSAELLRTLRADRHPILFEGLHCAYPLTLQGAFTDRRVLLRAHNVEHDYYRQLARREPNVLRRLYFRKEAWLLRRLLDRLPPTLPVAAIAPADTDYFRQRFTSTFWLPPFHSNTQVSALPGRGSYALYHGNLAVAENHEVAAQLIAAFAGGQVPLRVAGKDPPDALRSLAAAAGNVTLLANPGAAEMQQLIARAHVILLPTHQPTGIKLKLLESLYRGRHGLANRTMVAHTTLEPLVTLTERDFYAATLRLMQRPFTEADRSHRQAVLDRHYGTADNARRLVDWFTGAGPSR